MNRRPQLVYGILFAALLGVLVWQAVEHHRVKQAARVALINRAEDISSTLGLVMRSQRRFGGMISRERLESALGSLIRPGELNAIALLNNAGEVVASAGTTIDFATRNWAPLGEYWEDQTVTWMNLVDLGTNVSAEAEGPRPTIVLQRDDWFGPGGTNRPAPGPGPNSPNATNAAAPRPPPPSWSAPPPGMEPPPGPPPPGDDDNSPRRRGRHFRMNEEEYQEALKKKGVHSFAMVLSTQSVRAVSRQDFWLRLIIGALASVSVVGIGLAWRNLNRSSELELRLVRTSELNTRLKEMNLAAAGLAHETKNPLNIIRGLAQMISKLEAAPPEIRQKSRGIIDEADRVAAQLNEFINYSRPREIRRSAVALNSVVNEVVRALTFDIEEKAIRLLVPDDLPRIEADEPLLRQVLFNLLLNAIQAVNRQGQIQVIVTKQNPHAVLEIRDNGPGVPAEHRHDIFKPYFTTNQKGTGLGLAVVQQIVLAHGWEIECLPHEPQGAVFRLLHLRLATA